jgi:hypothetical protein
MQEQSLPAPAAFHAAIAWDFSCISASQPTS